MTCFFFQHFLLNSRPNKLKVFAKPKDSWLNSSRFLNKLKILLIKNKDFFAKLKEFSAKLKGFVVKLKIRATKFTLVVSRMLKKQACYKSLPIKLCKTEPFKTTKLISKS